MDLIETLPPLSRLALAYAPASVRARWLTLLALDARLSGVVRQAREPLLGQMKLAWWRDRLGDEAVNWPKGEPLLASLSCWQGEHSVLIGLVDGWEAVLTESSLCALGEGRAAACLALAQGEAVARMAQGWGLGDVAGFAQDREGLAKALSAQDWSGGRLPRALRPLVVLHGIAARQAKDPTKSQNIAMLTLMRLGLFGF
jgi:phytoene synthase